MSAIKIIKKEYFEKPPFPNYIENVLQIKT